MTIKKTTAKKITARERMLQEFDVLLTDMHAVSTERKDIASFILYGTNNDSFVVEDYPFMKERRNREEFFSYIISSRMRVLGHDGSGAYTEIHGDYLAFYFSGSAHEDRPMLLDVDAFYHNYKKIAASEKCFFRVLDKVLCLSIQQTVPALLEALQTHEVYALVGLNYTKIKHKPAQLNDLRELKAALVANTSI